MGAYAYTYDNLYRLTGATRPSQPAESFSYDRVGNRLTSADAANWAYNANNALTGYNGVSFQYDANGNTTSKTEGEQVTTIYIYRAKDRLEEVDLPDGRVASYKYDQFGRRISKTVTEADGVTTATTYFMYADEGLVAELNASGAVVKTYGWKPGSTWSTNPVLMTVDGNTYFYHNDHLGTPQKMTDSTGAVVWSATYTAFGEATVDAASTVTNNLRFPGQYWDAETGLHYNWHRYYDSKAGRYVSEDPIFLDTNENLYLYCYNNSVLYIDFSGLWCFSWISTKYRYTNVKIKFSKWEDVFIPDASKIEKIITTKLAKELAGEVIKYIIEEMAYGFEIQKKEMSSDKHILEETHRICIDGCPPKVTHVVFKDDTVVNVLVNRWYRYRARLLWKRYYLIEIEDPLNNGDEWDQYRHEYDDL